VSLQALENKALLRDINVISAPALVPCDVDQHVFWI